MSDSPADQAFDLILVGWSHDALLGTFYLSASWKDIDGARFSTTLQVPEQLTWCRRCMGEGDCSACQGVGQVILPDQSGVPGSIGHAIVEIWTKQVPPLRKHRRPRV